MAEIIPFPRKPGMPCKRAERRRALEPHPATSYQEPAPRLSEILAIWQQLTDADRQEVLAFAHFMLSDRPRGAR